ncbi:MAG: hypothetical protein ACOVOO_05820 [Flavobacteriales bacterium]|jgi:hypothetical protein
MKKITLIGALCIAACSFTSCKKSWTCNCVNNTDSEFTMSTSFEATKKNAEEQCDAFQEIDYTCTLKSN